MIEMVKGAELSPCTNYRYLLARPCGGPLMMDLPLAPSVGHEELRLRTVLWVMLNPSTADAMKDDPTIRAVRDFSARWGFWRFLVVNLFAWRATEPPALLKVAHPEGPMNDVWIQDAAASSDMVVTAWGASVPKLVAPRAKSVLELLRRTHDVRALAFTAEGQPRHPLYLVRDLNPLPWMEHT